MSEQLKKLLDNEILTEETKTGIVAVIDEMKESIITEEVAKITNELEVKFAGQLTEAKKTLSTDLYSLINESVTEEVNELKENIQYYKDLEVNYAQKLEDFKSAYSIKLNENVENFIDGLVNDEIAELKTSLTEAKKNNFGLMIFESYKDVFDKMGSSDDVKSIKDELASAKEELTESNKKIDELNRVSIMEGLLSNLEGSKREVMSTLLENVATGDLESKYNDTVKTVIGNTEDLNESDKDSDKGDSIVLAEDQGSKKELDRLRTLIG